MCYLDCIDWKWKCVCFGAKCRTILWNDSRWLLCCEGDSLHISLTSCGFVSLSFNSLYPALPVNRWMPDRVIESWKNFSQRKFVIFYCTKYQTDLSSTNYALWVHVNISYTKSHDHHAYWLNDSTVKAISLWQVFHYHYSSLRTSKHGFWLMEPRHLLRKIVSFSRFSPLFFQ